MQANDKGIMRFELWESGRIISQSLGKIKFILEEEETVKKKQTGCYPYIHKVVAEC